MSQRFAFLIFKLLVVLWLPSYRLVGCTKWLSGSNGFGHVSTWLDGYMPCARDHIIFPSFYPAVLPLPTHLDVSGFVLPRTGAILLAQDTEIILGGDVGACSSDEHHAYLKAPKIHKWYDPNSWADPKQLFRNPAIPELQRVPCDNEEVIVTRNDGPLAFDLENVQYLRMGQFILAGSSLSKDYLQNLLSSDIGELLFHNSAGTRVEYYHDGACGCHKNFNHMLESICHNVRSSSSDDTSCVRPHCLAPVVPYGSCCTVCGAVLRFAVEHCAGDKIKQLRKIINDQLTKDDMAAELNVFVHYMSSDEYGNYLQAVIVDRDTYSERSVEFMRRLNASESMRHFLRSNTNNLQLHLAGRPYNPNITFGSVLLILGCIIFVGIVALIIFAHYTPNNRYLNNIPQWLHDTRRWRALWQRSSFVFARFDNGANPARSSGVERLNIHERILGYDAVSGEVRERSFNNPMFEEEEIIGTAVATKTQMEQPTTPSTSSAAVPVAPPAELATDSIEEQELTEIHLDTSDDDSDIEAETAK